MPQRTVQERLRRFFDVCDFFRELFGRLGLCRVDQQNSWTSRIPISAPRLSKPTSRMPGVLPDTKD